MNNFKKSRQYLTVITQVVLATPLAIPLYAMASPGSEALHALSQNDWVERSISLADVGITNPVVLQNADNVQSFFLPVPKGVMLDKASINLQGAFIKGEEPPAALTISVDSRPVYAQKKTEHEGTLNEVLPVEARRRDEGFVDFTLNWSSPNGQKICDPTQQSANTLTVLPETALTYRYSLKALTSLADAWRTLPAKPVIMIASGKLDQQSFDSAWRLGVNLERADKRAQVHAFPAVGDVVSLDGVNVPGALATVAPFSALADKGQHTLGNAAEIGALLVLGAPATQADLAIADTALIGQINTALDALQAQLQTDSDAAKELQQWRASHATLSQKVPGSQQVLLANLGYKNVISVAPDAGAKAGGLFESQWRDVLVSPQATITQLSDHSMGPNQTVRIARLGGSIGAFDVVSRGDWTAVFPLSAVAVDGRMPGEVVIDVAAAPGASSTRPVATVLWNDTLLGAKQLKANGESEQIVARVPGYALGVTNVLKVRFQRQPVSPNCFEIPQGYPVNVLPTSFLRTSDAEPDGTFVGLLPLLAGPAQVIAPKDALDHPAESLRQIIRLSSAASISPLNAELVLADNGTAFKPTKPFLSVGVPVDGAEPLIVVKDGKSLQANHGDTTTLDLTGPQPLSAASVAQSNNQQGVIWYPLGDVALTTPGPFVLNRGNAVVLGEEGPLTWVDTSDPELSQALRLNESPMYQWRKYLSWGLPLLGGFLVLMVVLAMLARRHKKN